MRSYSYSGDAIGMMAWIGVGIGIHPAAASHATKRERNGQLGRKQWEAMERGHQCTWRRSAPVATCDSPPKRPFTCRRVYVVLKKMSAVPTTEYWNEDERQLLLRCNVHVTRLFGHLRARAAHNTLNGVRQIELIVGMHRIATIART